MSVRVRYKVEVTISSTASEERDLGNVRREAVTDSLGEGGTWETLVVAGATNVQLPLASIADSQLLVIITTPKNPNDSYSTISIRLNSTSGELRPIEKLGDCKEGIWMASTSGVTALFATNAGSTDMKVIICAAGD
jgi:hypothetical protein